MIKIREDSKFIIKFLMLPLIAIITIFYLLNFYYFKTPNDLISNLITDLVSIIISAGFVSFILDKSQKRIWKETDEKIKDRVTLLINSYTSYLCDWLNYPSNTKFKIRINENRDEKLIQIELMEFTKNVLKDFDVRSKGDVNWELLFNGAKAHGIEDDGLKQVELQLDKILTRHGEKINPEIYSKILDMEKLINNILKSYWIIPQLFINPDFSNIYQNQLRSHITSELKNALETAIDLYEILNNLNTKKIDYESYMTTKISMKIELK